MQLAPYQCHARTCSAVQLGPYQLANRLIVAPMAGVTDRPFRKLCKRLGAGLAISEMVAADLKTVANESSRVLNARD